MKCVHFVFTKEITKNYPKTKAIKAKTKTVFIGVKTDTENNGEK